jgi:glutamate 5-kinase
MIDLVRQMAQLREAGSEVILITSGAIAVGREALDFPHLVKDIPAKQMLSAVGQPRLMDLWGKLFEIYGHRVAQLLLTRNDLQSRSRYLNARNTVLALLTQGVIPVINENDTVATEEIRVGDNDNLSALVANLIDADLLVLLTDQKGLFGADPRKNPQARLVSLVDAPTISEELWEAAGGSSALGVGGMFTKLQAADLARRSGTYVVIAQGSAPDIILKIKAGESVGTRFTPTTTAIESRKRFLLSANVSGKVQIDQGAVSALTRGGSLLPVGLNQVDGQFSRGDIISIATVNEKEIGRGMANYNAEDCSRLCGLHSTEIENRLGYFYGEEIIHRNNLILL